MAACGVGARTRVGDGRFRRRLGITALALAMASGAVAAGAATASSATVLTVAGAGYVTNPMSTELQGALCRSPHVCQAVDYPTVGLFNQPLVAGLAKLTEAIDTTSGPKVVMAYSQGAMIATSWLQKHATDANSPSSDEMTLVLFANPQRALGGNYPSSGLGSATPDTQYKVIDVCRQYDGECDWPTNPFNVLAVINAFMGYTTVHGDYTGVDINASENLIRTIGNTTYIVAPTDRLPLLDPLRRIGLGALADQWNASLKAMIDAGYDRSGYTTIGHTGPVDPFPVSDPSPAPSRAADTSAATDVVARRLERSSGAAVATTPTGQVGVPAADAVSDPSADVDTNAVSDADALADAPASNATSAPDSAARTSPDSAAGTSPDSTVDRSTGSPADAGGTPASSDSTSGASGVGDTSAGTPSTG